MQTAVEATIQAIVFIVQVTPIGTNLGLANLMWAMASGSFFLSRGGVFPALQLVGLNAGAIRRSWSAMHNGSWETDDLVENWGVYVAQENEWRENRYEGLQVVSIDLTGFSRPRLQGWAGKHYHSVVGKAIPAVVFGVMTISGHAHGKRLPLLYKVIRCQPEQEKSEYQVEVLRQAALLKQPREVNPLDAGFKLSELAAADLKDFVLLRNKYPERRDSSLVYRHNRHWRVDPLRMTELVSSSFCAERSASVTQKELLPAEHLVDSGYIDVENVLDSQQQEVELVGPMRPDSSWQSREKTGYDIAHFVVDWQAETVTCPQGHSSHVWSHSTNKEDVESITVRFHPDDCTTCPVRELCTRSKSGPRGLRLQTQEKHETLQQARQHQKSDAFWDRYRTRAGIEGTISQTTRAFGLRRTRYIGDDKTRLQHLATATALNLSRLANWLSDLPRAQTRVSPFAELTIALIC